jgi:methionyl-tRNA formyltransferase
VSEGPALAVPPPHPHRLVYLGTPQVAVPPLEALVAAGFDIALVVSAPDKRRGRGSRLAPSPVKAVAVDLGLPVTDRVDDVVDVGADLGVVVAYGRLVKRPVLERVPMVNLHFSLLPRWRGAAPVERAILSGDRRTGVCLMALEEGLDTGGVYRRAVEPIHPDDTVDALRSRLVAAGTDLLVDALREGLGDPEPQTGEITYARKLTPDDHRLDLAAPVAHLDRVVRLGGAWCTFRDKRFKVWAARPVDRPAGELPPGALDGLFVACVDGGLELLEVQPEGRPRMSAVDWRNGAQPRLGERLV